MHNSNLIIFDMENKRETLSCIIIQKAVYIIVTKAIAIEMAVANFILFKICFHLTPIQPLLNLLSYGYFSTFSDRNRMDVGVGMGDV